MKKSLIRKSKTTYFRIKPFLNGCYKFEGTETFFIQIFESLEELVLEEFENDLEIINDGYIILEKKTHVDSVKIDFNPFDDKLVKSNIEFIKKFNNLVNVFIYCVKVKKYLPK